MSEIKQKAKRAKEITYDLATISTEEKDRALVTMAKQLEQDTDLILNANAKDITNGKEQGFSDTLLDRLTLTRERIADMADGLRQVATLTDPIGEVLQEIQRPNGLKIEQKRVPLGVIGIIYEARPNVTVDAAGLCLKAGNAVLLRGSSSAIHSNQVIVHSLQQALEGIGFIKEAIQLIEDTSRESATELFTLTEYLDVLIPRGGASLIKAVVENASVPVLETGVGNCHIYIDETANFDMASTITINAKTQRPSVCNAAETLLIHRKWANKNLSSLLDQLKKHKVDLFGEEELLKWDPDVTVAKHKDWAEEYLDLKIAIKLVDSTKEAIAHIRTYGTHHSEAIISESAQNVTAFLNGIDAAAVYHNASTRFTDGFEFGFGAEIGISTQKLHARGPMGLEALTSTKYMIFGEGQIKS
ncbi:glutamate-5-semialdehyde dehydrogenase [Alkalicoccobacillus murimartini]|uniref:Gamma-glutamyl phosphate reductase n=1 Tax=Alkalicoccobacillus murimartini TaxID=171685 RepID=A0ABT9YCT0_9BACI|nr:glutamate-5-semialdehyde dehydrogenase [Alkalicoccobacillus murimartini]MDQ0205658.1 glutamate-5-semialdehyde dehydrogenase [Alkalicoccobacillus murimartini]